MKVIVKLIGAAILAPILAVAVFLADAAWNRSGLFYAAVGRDGLVQACTPATREGLAAKGFSPADITFGDQPSIGVSYGGAGATKRLEAPITFSDGPNGPLVAGRVACVVSGRSIQVDVEADDLPRRVT